MKLEKMEIHPLSSLLIYFIVAIDLTKLIKEGLATL